MRVLAISSYPGLGGAEIAMDGFLAHRPANVDARVLVLGDGPLAGRLRGQGLDVTIAEGFAGRPGPPEALRFGRLLHRALGAWRPDVVWACGQKAALLSVVPCRARRVPLVWHKVDFSWDRRLGRPLAAAVNGLVSVSDAVVAPLGAAGARRHLGSVGVPVTLPADLRAVPDPERPLLVTLSRLVPYKGIDRMIEAVALVRARHPGVRLVVAGGPVAEYPDHPAELAARVDRLGLGDAVELRGFVDDVSGILAGASVFLNATYRDEEGFGLEGMPGSILEAAWMGIPTVAPGTGGNAEAVVDGETGTLVAEPEPALLAAAITPYLDDAALWRRTSEHARAWAQERFAPGHAAARLFAALSRAAR